MSEDTEPLKECKSDGAKGEHRIRTDSSEFTTNPYHAVVDGPVDAKEYLMLNPKRGKCVIFNHTIFNAELELDPRKGTFSDVCQLRCTFRELGFEVILHDNLKEEEIKSELQKVSKDTHTDCFVCCFLTHGKPGALYASDAIYPIENILAPFRNDACESLCGKPKIFIIQACRGDEKDFGVKISFRESADSGKPKQKKSNMKYTTCTIPVFADFLVIYASYLGYSAFDYVEDGSPFIQVLCKMLHDHSKDMDLLSILTLVNYEIAYKFISYNSKDSDLNRKKQIPCFNSSLTRMLKFPPLQTS